MVKDIQATANSAVTRDKEKYIVVGADQQTRTITGCNPADYDDASIRQLLEQYLDPVPEFEVLSLKSSANVDFVVLRFPYQENRPIYARDKSAAIETEFIWTLVRFGLSQGAPIRAALESGWLVRGRNFWA